MASERMAEVEEPEVAGQSEEVVEEEETTQETEATREAVEELLIEASEETVETQIETEGLMVSEDVYTRTFSELERRILEWDALIARKDYESWYSSLSRAYVAERTSADYLAKLSKSQRLRDSGIALKSLRDYFLNVVVPSRLNAGLDRIEFVDDGEVKAYADIDGEAAILYYVVWEDGVWKIGTGEECRTASRTE